MVGRSTIFSTEQFYSNHIVAYVRSISGPAVEKPPQDNQILQEDTFSLPHLLRERAGGDGHEYL